MAHISRYTNWSWQPTSKVANAIKDGRKRFTAARELQRSIAIGEPTMEQVKQGLEAAIGPVVKAPAKKVAKKVPAKKPAAKKVAKKVVKPAPAAAKGTKGTALKQLVPTGMDTKVARRILRKAGIKGHDAKARWVFDAAQAAEVRKLLAKKG